ncbi:MAG: neutral/alkaline non-lysosomal ceramidase N-terminal domain-containing protein [Chitinophagaceae bacterium]|nr:neutral/alkaline non-lysosomal ceramidase N-terminal domain-containing protein [Chitinophagaceae bacterium]
MKKYTSLFFLLFVLSVMHIQASAQSLKAGIGRKVITPTDPAWLNGYASPKRFSPAEGKDHDLWAKAIVLEDAGKKRVVIVTTDVLGLSHEISEDVGRKVMEKYGIPRSQVLLNSSHTHSGPMVWPSAGMFDYDTKNMIVVAEYAQKLTNDIVEAVGSAIAVMHPVKLASGNGNATFGINRRSPEIKIRPVDHDVPVLTISDLQGKLEAVLFGYACHNTTLGGDYMKINGDYAGYAQLEMEASYPGITALFFQGCAGDINPEPRGTVELAEQHGKTLSAAVQKVINNSMTPVDGLIRANLIEVPLEFPPLDVQQYQREILSEDQYLQRRAKLMLSAYNKRWDVTTYKYPIQAIRFGKSLSILAMAGETVVDYSLWAKKQYSKENLFVAGYSNEVMCYIPTKRIIGEGGYEPNSSMIYYVMPGPFSENVEEKILKGIQAVMKNVGIKPE